MKVKMKERWKWDDDENEMTITEPERKMGNAKRKRKKREHQHQHTWPETGKPWKGKEKEKADGRRAKKPTRGGGADRSAWHNLQGESQSLPRNAKDPNLT